LFSCGAKLRLYPESESMQAGAGLQTNIQYTAIDLPSKCKVEMLSPIFLGISAGLRQTDIKEPDL